MKVFLLSLMMFLNSPTFAEVIKDRFLEAQINAIERSHGLEKVTKILDFIPYYPRGLVEINLTQGKIALKELDNYDAPKLKSILYSKLVWPAIYSGQSQLSKNYLSKAENYAMQADDNTCWVWLFLAKSFKASEQRRHLQAVVESEKAYSLAETLADDLLVAQVLLERGLAYSDAGNRLGAQSDLLRALSLIKNLPDNYLKKVYLLSSLAMRLTVHFRKSSDYNRALKYALFAVAINRDAKNEKALASAYNNVAVIYKDLKSYQNAIEMQLKSLLIKEKYNYVLGLIYSHRNLGEAYRLAGQFDLALKHLDKSALLAEQNNLQKYAMEVFLYKGRLFLDQGKINEAELFLNKAEAVFNKANTPSRIAEVNLDLARLSKIKGHHDAAIQHLEKSIQLARKVGKASVEVASLELCIEIYEELNQSDLAYFYLKQLHTHFKEQLSNQGEQWVVDLKANFSIHDQLDAAKIPSQTAAKTKPSAQLYAEFIAANFLYIMISLSVLAILFGFIWLGQIKRSRAQLAEEYREHHSALINLLLADDNQELWQWQCEGDEIKRHNPCLEIGWRSENGVLSLSDFEKVLHPEDTVAVVSSLNSIGHKKQQQLELICRVRNQQNDWFWIKLKAYVAHYKYNKNNKQVNALLSRITESRVRQLEGQNVQ